MHLDEVLGLSPLAVDVVVEMLGVTGQSGHDIAGIEALCRRLEPGDDSALGCPACRRIAGFRKAAQPGSAMLGPRDLERVIRQPPVGAADWPLSLLPAPFPMGQVVDFYAAAWPNFTPALTHYPEMLPRSASSSGQCISLFYDEGQFGAYGEVELYGHRDKSGQGVLHYVVIAT
jgi:hypothetical protein